MSLKDKIQARASEFFAEVKAIREHLHQHPELSYQEHETMAFVSEQLTKFGIAHTKGVADTGVVGLIKADHHTGEEACIALRADLDALPIFEKNEVSYCSKNEGVMHACGHDVHTSILLGAAKIIQSLRNELKQPIKLVFQPGEEQNPGGASLMIKAGVLDNPKVERMYGLHVFPEMEVGKLGFRGGLYMASSDEIHVTISGQGGHGAQPHKTVDSILVGAEIVTSLQKIVSRSCDPTMPCVLTFGHFEAMGATNIIPAEVKIKGTFRTMDETWRAKALEMIKFQIENIAQTHGATADVFISHGYPFLKNDEGLTEELKVKARKLLGDANVEDLPLRMTSEDFAFYSQEVPTSFYRLGVRNEEKGIIHGVHTSKFDIDPHALEVGMQMMAAICFDI
ncbi:amidohydrolase [Lishizhenia tianjinensis]|uniref:Amidohydrolase n=1 Tax=Lishizhenia tianjinensis TaxID=477690 RepID=A0A1I7A114_9FLAO|nr:amidohydrolase [Lishizhenia tianjinensis]SFT68613.1 amidohydrolase [Lishizhenia tianjinensis]